MKRVLGVLLAAFIGVGAFVGIADAQTPSAEVKAAICVSASVDAVSFPADGRAANAKSKLDSAETALKNAVAAATGVEDQIGNLKTAAAVSARIKVLRDFVAGANPDADKAIAQSKIDVDVKLLVAFESFDKATDESERALSAQKDAVDLEADVKAFVGTRSFATVKSDLCTVVVPPTSTTTVPPPPPAFVDLDCIDFPLNGRTAQEELDRTPGEDPHNLDANGNRIACEVVVDNNNNNDNPPPPQQVIQVPVGGVATGDGSSL